MSESWPALEGTAPPDRRADRGARVVPYHCPFCAESDLRPHPMSSGAWHCRACLRTFAVSFMGLAPADPPPVPDAIVADPPGAS